MFQYPASQTSTNPDLSLDLRSYQRTFSPLHSPLPASTDLIRWSRHYLPHHFSRAPSGMHGWLNSQLGNFHVRRDGSRGGKINVIGPLAAGLNEKSDVAIMLAESCDSLTLGPDWANIMIPSLLAAAGGQGAFYWPSSHLIEIPTNDV